MHGHLAYNVGPFFLAKIDSNMPVNQPPVFKV